MRIKTTWLIWDAPTGGCARTVETKKTQIRSTESRDRKTRIARVGRNSTIPGFSTRIRSGALMERPWSLSSLISLLEIENPFHRIGLDSGRGLTAFRARLNNLQPGLFCVWGHRPVGLLKERISRQLFASAQERNRDRPTICRRKPQSFSVKELAVSTRPRTSSPACSGLGSQPQGS